MSEYGNPEVAILGMKADNNPVTRIESFAAAEDIGFGIPVFVYQGETEKCYKYHNDTGKIVYSTDFIADNSTIVTVDGEDTAPVVFDTTHILTITNLLAAITALADVDAALDPADTNNLTILIRKKGADVVVSSATTLGISQPTTVVTYISDQVFAGVAMMIQKDVDSTDARYRLNQTISVMSVGKLWASLKDEDILSGSVAYLETAGADAGKFSVDGSAVNCKFRSNKETNAATTDVMANVEVNGQIKINPVISWT